MLQIATQAESTLRAGSLDLYRLDLRPPGAAQAALAIFHGYGEHCRRYVPLMQRCAESGIACATIDWPGHGRSRGRRGDIQSWDQLVECISALLADPLFRSLPTFVVGHSFGALVAARAAQAGLLERCRGVILCSPYLRNGVPVSPMKHLVAWIARRVLPHLLLPSNLPVEWLSSDPDMVEEARRDPLLLRRATPRWYFLALGLQARTLAGSLRLPMLMLLGDGDRVADPDVGERFFNSASSPDKTLHRYPGMKHELLRETVRGEVMERIVGWIGERARPHGAP